MNETQQLCEFLCKLTVKDIPEIWQKDLRYRVLDWLGCTLGSIKTDSSRIVLSMAENTGGAPQSVILGLEDMYPQELAGFVNGVMGHTLEYDDVCKIAIGHPGSVSVPAALCTAQKYKADADTFFAAVAAGYEAFVRIGAVLNPSHYRFWHTTGTSGVFAAAAAAGRVMGLSCEQMQRAFGIAATMASGLIGVFGTDAKMVTVGNAVKNGITAAELAKAGFSAPCDILESESGYIRAASESDDISFLVKDLGNPLMISNTGYKIYASCGHTHSALDALFELLHQHPIRADQIESIQVEVYTKAAELAGTFKNSTEAVAKFSLPYCIAAGILFGAVTLKEFTPKALCDEKLLQLKDKISVTANPDYDKRYPAIRTQRVTICAGGTCFEKQVDLPLQIPPYELLEKKFSSLCAMTITPQSATLIRNTLMGLQGKDKIEILTKTLGGIEICQAV